MSENKAPVTDDEGWTEYLAWLKGSQSYIRQEHAVTIDRASASVASLHGRIETALATAAEYGTAGGEHHKMWVIDQMVRALAGCPMTTLRSDYPGASGQYYEYQGLGENSAYRKVTGEDWDKGVTP